MFAKVESVEIVEVRLVAMQLTQDAQVIPASTKIVRTIEDRKPRIGLITPYNGGNLGDAAIQDSMIANLRLRAPGAQFLGITLNGEGFVEKHGAEAFPLLASQLAPAQPASPRIAHPSRLPSQTASSGTALRPNRVRWIRRILGRVLGGNAVSRGARTWLVSIRRECVHAVDGFRALRTLDLLLFSGGGQLDDEYGGPWRLPYAFCKWTVLARLAGVPCAMVSVGAGSLNSIASRRLVAVALRMCCYRAFRETRSRSIAATLWSPAASDPVVQDLAFSLPASELPKPDGAIRSLAGGRQVIAISPICFGKPGSWPTPNRALYDRYIEQLGKLISHLSKQGYFLVVACSSLGDDETVITDLMDRADEGVKQCLNHHIYIPPVKSWRDFVGVLHECDYLIASRLHGTILGFVTQIPVLAISFNPKVDWVMEDLNLTDYLLQIREFTCSETLLALERLKVNRRTVIKQIADYRHAVLNASETKRQFDLLIGLALKQPSDSGDRS